MLLILFLICSFLVILMYKNNFTISESFQNIENNAVGTYGIDNKSIQNDTSNYENNCVEVSKSKIFKRETLDDKFYHTDKKDCILDSSCQLPPNNINFFKVKPTKRVIARKNCSLTSKNISNCSSISGNCIQKRQFECSGIPKEKHYLIIEKVLQKNDQS